PAPDQMAKPGTGPAVHGSPAWNRAGYRGQGIKVGVIDGGFTGLSGLLGTELPAIVQARCYTSASDSPTSNLSDCETDTHGTVVAESVLDIAPDVELYIANPDSDGDLQDAVDWMADQGVDVINHSMSYRFLTPGDGTSPYSDSPLKAVNRAVKNGIVWVNSAGNAAQKTWFKRAPFSYSSLRYIRFEVSDSSNRVSLRKGQDIRVQLRWDDNWTTGATSDLGLYIQDPSALKLLESADNWQDGEPGQIPFEFLTFVAPSDGEYDLLVKRWSRGTEPDWIQLTLWGRPTLEHSTANGSIGNPGESANPGMLTVGAAHWNDVNTIESYSSQGPLPDGRIKPDVVGAACGQTKTETLSDGGYYPFCGTSQASPHVAGMAALVRQAFPQSTPAQVVAYLKENAQQRVGKPDPNNTWGHGFAVLPATALHTVSCTNGTTVPDPANNPGLVRDCETLLSSRDQLRGSGNLNWSGDTPVTMWGGILLGGSPRRVRELALGNNSLTGTIPAELGNLDGLEQLSIINNQLTGTIPAELGNLSNLRGLSLNNNQLTGTIPSQLGNLSNLRGLDLGNNQLTGTIPSWLGNRVNLVGLNLGNNRLTGTIPSQLGNLSNLQQLYLENNQLAGNLPHSLANLGALQSFDFYLNPGLCAQDDSTIQAWLDRVNRVRGPDCAPTVRLSAAPSHLIEGAGATSVTVTATRAAASSNTTVNLRRGGSAREWRDYRVTRARSITIPANATSGTTTLTFTPLADGVTEGHENIILQAVVVENQTEAIEGSAVITLSDEGTSIPCEARDRAVLEAFYNATGGANWTTNTNWLSSLTLSDWQGVTVDGNGCVAVLTLSDNQLTGTLPSELGNLASLEGLNLYNNDLTGSIPASLGNLAKLEELYLHNNQLTGTIPTQLGNLANLQVLHLNSNQLAGPIPIELGNLTNLRGLYLDSNQLTGAIPVQLGNLANLQVLDLRNNQLTGTLPQSFTSMGALTAFYFNLNPGLCAQADPTLQAWLNGVRTVQGPDCSPTVRLSVNPSRLVEGSGATPVTVTAMRTAVSSPTTVELRRGGSAAAFGVG
ncbi:MAG: S8 family serine peptidase, partial [Acidimicrobiaceae bacterium]|nr:S8 family serine peptidase [Acidimicrobiaceae bacterium]